MLPRRTAERDVASSTDGTTTDEFPYPRCDSADSVRGVVVTTLPEREFGAWDATATPTTFKHAKTTEILQKSVIVIFKLSSLCVYCIIFRHCESIPFLFNTTIDCIFYPIAQTSYRRFRFCCIRIIFWLI